MRSDRPTHRDDQTASDENLAENRARHHLLPRRCEYGSHHPPNCLQHRCRPYEIPGPECIMVLPASYHVGHRLRASVL